MKEDLSLWAFGHAVIMLLSVVVGLLYDEALFVLLWTVSISLTGLIIMTSPVWWKLRPVGGYANMVTLGRCILLVITLSFHSVLSPWFFSLLILIVVIADGIDGFLARRFHQTTAFGEVFDTEVDAFLALALSILIWRLHPQAYWVLGAGVMRYAFVIIYRILRWHKKLHQGIKEAKLMAVLFFLSLLTPFILPWNIALWFTVFGCAVVTYSFLSEFYMIWKID